MVKAHVLEPKLFFDTVEQVIVPGLEMHGIPARRAWSRVATAATDGLVGL